MTLEINQTINQLVIQQTTGDTLEITTQGPQGPAGPSTTFTVAGNSGPSQTISNGDTLTLTSPVSFQQVVMSATDTATFSWPNQSGRVFLASPSDGSAGTPAFRAIVALDIANLSPTFTNLIVNGNTTLGDAAADTLTINGTAVTIPNGLNFDSNTLVIDAANNRIGFNVAAPGNLLDARLDQNATTAIRLMNNNTSASARLAFVWNNGTSDLATMQYNLNSPNLFITTSGAVPLYLGTSNTIQLSILSTGFTGVGTSGALTRFQVVDSDSGTNNVVNVFRVDRNSSGTVAAGFGIRNAWFLENAIGTTGRFAGAIDVLWNVATSAGEIPDVVLYAVYANGTLREGMRIRGSTSETRLSFFGVTPVVRQALGAWAGLTTDQKLDALRDALTNLGLTSFT